MSHKHSDMEDKAKVAGIAGLAALVGAAVALLFAPRTGKQTRDELNKRAKSTIKQVEDKVAPVIEEPSMKQPASRASTARRPSTAKPKTATLKPAPRRSTTRKPTSNTK